MAVEEIFNAVVEFNEANVMEYTRRELEAGTDVTEILNRGLIAAMDEVGERFSDGTLFVPEMLMAAQSMKAGLNILRPMLKEGDTKEKGTVVLGTVKGDLHDIGKNLVAMMLEGAGFKVVDLGVDVDVDKFVDAVVEHQADIVGLSALLTTTMPAMENIVKAVKEKSGNVKIIIGGAPVTRDFSEKIGSDGYGEDAPAAVRVARTFVKN